MKLQGLLLGKVMQHLATVQINRAIQKWKKAPAGGEGDECGCSWVPFKVPGGARESPPADSWAGRVSSGWGPDMREEMG